MQAGRVLLPTQPPAGRPAAAPDPGPSNFKPPRRHALQVLFSACDILAGWLILRVVRAQGATPAAAAAAAALWLFNPWTLAISTRGSCDVLVVVLLL